MTDAPAASPPMNLHAGADTNENARLLTSIIYGLYLGGFLTGPITPIAGVIIAYVAKGSAPEWAKSHYTFQIWTFWLTVLVAVLFIPLMVAWFVTGAVLSLILIGIPMLILGALLIFVPFVWFAVRCALGLTYSLQMQPYPRPQALLA